MGSDERGGAAGGAAWDEEAASTYDPEDDSATELVVPDEIRARGRPSPPPQEPGADAAVFEEKYTYTERMDPTVMAAMVASELAAAAQTEADRERAVAAQADADPIVEVGPIDGHEVEHPAEQTLESIDVDIQRPALPFDAPTASPTDEPPLQSRVRAPEGGSIEDPQTASGLISVPTSEALPFSEQAAPASGEPTDPQPQEAQSLWSRKRQHSTVDPAELPSSLAPSALQRPAAADRESSSRSAWLFGALVALAAGLVLALALSL